MGWGSETPETRHACTSRLMRVRVEPAGQSACDQFSCSTLYQITRMVEYTEDDQKPQIEEECKVHCVAEWNAYKACAERIKSDTTGQAHCSGQYFDFWKCVDHCAAPKIFAHLK